MHESPTSTIGDLSKLVTNTEGYKKHQDMIMQMAMRDPGLSPEDRRLLHNKLMEPGFFDKVMHGAGGAAIMYAMSKFLNMSKETQVLMSMMGFGVGSILLDATEKSDKGTTYNKDKKVYEIKS